LTGLRSIDIVPPPVSTAAETPRVSRLYQAFTYLMPGTPQASTAPIEEEPPLEPETEAEPQPEDEPEPEAEQPEPESVAVEDPSVANELPELAPVTVLTPPESTSSRKLTEKERRKKEKEEKRCKKMSKKAAAEKPPAVPEPEPQIEPEPAVAPQSVEAQEQNDETEKFMDAQQNGEPDYLDARLGPSPALTTGPGSTASSRLSGKLFSPMHILMQPQLQQLQQYQEQLQQSQRKEKEREQGEKERLELELERLELERTKAEAEEEAAQKELRRQQKEAEKAERRERKRQDKEARKAAKLAAVASLPPEPEPEFVHEVEREPGLKAEPEQVVELKTVAEPIVEQEYEACLETGTLAEPFQVEADECEAGPDHEEIPSPEDYASDPPMLTADDYDIPETEVEFIEPPEPERIPEPQPLAKATLDRVKPKREKSKKMDMANVALAAIEEMKKTRGPRLVADGSEIVRSKSKRVRPVMGGALPATKDDEAERRVRKEHKRMDREAKRVTEAQAIGVVEVVDDGAARERLRMERKHKKAAAKQAEEKARAHAEREEQRRLKEAEKAARLPTERRRSQRYESRPVAANKETPEEREARREARRARRAAKGIFKEPRSQEGRLTSHEPISPGYSSTGNAYGFNPEQTYTAEDLEHEARRQRRCEKKAAKMVEEGINTASQYQTSQSDYHPRRRQTTSVHTRQTGNVEHSHVERSGTVSMHSGSLSPQHAAAASRDARFSSSFNELLREEEARRERKRLRKEAREQVGIKKESSVAVDRERERDGKREKKDRKGRIAVEPPGDSPEVRREKRKKRKEGRGKSYGYSGDMTDGEGLGGGSSGKMSWWKRLF
jgi:hypothetical protein